PPKRRGSPSRSSTGSRRPGDAPEGTPAQPVAPPSRPTVTDRVGRPRESRISRARIQLSWWVIRLSMGVLPAPRRRRGEQVRSGDGGDPEAGGGGQQADAEAGKGIEERFEQSSVLD